MRLLMRMLALSRAARMRRQFRDIEQRTLALPPPTAQMLAELVTKECAAAERLEAPHMYGSPPDIKPGSWGTGMELGHERARSDNTQVRLRGIALWIAVAYHETRQSSFPEFADLHRDVLRVMRVVKQKAAPPAEESKSWTKRADEAAA